MKMTGIELNDNEPDSLLAVQIAAESLAVPSPKPRRKGSRKYGNSSRNNLDGNPYPGRKGSFRKFSRTPSIKDKD